jgi:hypothetical protein
VGGVDEIETAIRHPNQQLGIAVFQVPGTDRPLFYAKRVVASTYVNAAALEEALEVPPPDANIKALGGFSHSK